MLNYKQKDIDDRKRKRRVFLYNLSISALVSSSVRPYRAGAVRATLRTPASPSRFLPEHMKGKNIIQSWRVHIHSYV